MSNPIIALHGLPRVGKDTLTHAILASNPQARQFSFADALYEDVARIFETTVAQLRTHEWKTEPQDALALVRAKDPAYRQALTNNGVKPFDTQTSRFHLQQYGTNYMQWNHGRAYWAERLMHILVQHADATDGTIVITDLRRYGESFHELDSLRLLAKNLDRQLIVVRVQREGVAVHASSHESDAVYPPSAIDINLFNNGTPEQLFERFTAALHAFNHPKEMTA